MICSQLETVFSGSVTTYSLPVCPRTMKQNCVSLHVTPICLIPTFTSMTSNLRTDACLHMMAIAGPSKETVSIHLDNKHEVKACIRLQPRIGQFLFKKKTIISDPTHQDIQVASLF